MFYSSNNNIPLELTIALRKYVNYLEQFLTRSHHYAYAASTKTKNRHFQTVGDSEQKESHGNYLRHLHMIHAVLSLSALLSWLIILSRTQ